MKQARLITHPDKCCINHNDFCNSIFIYVNDFYKLLEQISKNDDYKKQFTMYKLISNYYDIIQYNKDIFVYFALIFSRKKDFVMALVYFGLATDEGLGCFDFIFKEQTFLDNIGDPELKIKIDTINNKFPEHNKEHYNEFTNLLENYNKKKNQDEKEKIIIKKRKNTDDNDGNPIKKSK
jgi:hypothetical protein